MNFNTNYITRKKIETGFFKCKFQSYINLEGLGGNLETKYDYLYEKFFLLLLQNNVLMCTFRPSNKTY